MYFQKLIAFGSILSLVVAKYSPITLAAPTPSPSPTTITEPTSTADGFTTFPCGLNWGKHQLLPSMMVRGKEDGTQAIDFPNWSIPFNVLTQTLKIQTKTLPDGLLELRSSAAVARIDPKQLTTYPEIGLAIKIRDIEKYLGIKSEFDLTEYTIRVTLPQAVGGGSSKQATETPIEFDGLKIETPEPFTWSAFEQKFNIDGTDRVDRSQGLFKAAGTLYGASWYTQLEQSNWHDGLKLTLGDAQIVKYTNYTDYIIGRQSAFWNRQDSSNYWGITGIWRQGFTPLTSTSGTVTVGERTQASRLGRSIIGTAAPGTVVRLLPNNSTQIIEEILVDGTGVYRFDNIPVSRDANNYRLWLFANGQLSATPEERDVKFVTVPGQLPTGATATIASVGLRRESGAFWGSFGNIGGALVTNWGVSEWLTLGAGIGFDKLGSNGIQSLGELYFQPNGIPLEAAISMNAGSQFDLLSNVTYQPASNLRFQWNSDRLSHRIVSNWQISPQLTLNSTYDSRDAWGWGFQYNASSGVDSRTSIQASFDTNSRLRWRIGQTLGQWQLNYQGNEVGKVVQLGYSASPRRSVGHQIEVSYQTNQLSPANDYGILTWRYRPENKAPWSLDLGYGIGSVGGGWIASTQAKILPGMNLRGRYQTGINSLTPSFSLELVSALETQDGWRENTQAVEELRTQGGIAIVPFFDRNANGIQDADERAYLDIELINLNYRPLKLYRPQIQGGQIRLRIAPGKYRLDFDPSGFPIGWRTQASGYGVEVAAGSYTTVLVPLVMSYTIQGVITDRTGQPLNGAKVEAIPDRPQQQAESIFSITNANGEYYLEALPQGIYQIRVNGKSISGSQLKLNPSSEQTQTFNIKLSK